MRVNRAPPRNAKNSRAILFLFMLEVCKEAITSCYKE